MSARFIVGDLNGLSQVCYEGHTVLWKRMVLGFHLDGNWECVEYARVEKGIYFPAHLHDRTEELYYLLSGRATFITDGVPEDAGPGDLVLTRLNQSHAVQVEKSEDLSLLIVELIPKKQPQAGNIERCVFSFGEPVAARERSEKGVLRISSFDASRLSEGGWGKIERWVLPAGSASVPQKESAAEVCFLTVRGTGSARLEGGESVALTPGAILVVTPQAGYTLEATGRQDLTLLAVEVKLA